MNKILVLSLLLSSTCLIAQSPQDSLYSIWNDESQTDTARLMAFEMRAGIHTGPIVAGIVGVKKFQYDIWGDTVNTASRMESSGGVSQVNISQHTYELIKDETEFSFTKREKIEVKGKGEKQMYFVERAMA